MGIPPDICFVQIKLVWYNQSMIMTYHYFQNIDADSHYEKMKQGDSIKIIPYVPDLNTYVYAGRINFDTTEEFGVEYPESLWDCVFSIGVENHFNDNYAAIKFIKSDENLSRKIRPTDILLLDNMAWMYATQSAVDHFGCKMPFEFLSIDLKIILDKVKDLQ